MRNSAELMEDINKELNHMITVPQMDISQRAQQVELSISANAIKILLVELCDNELYLLNRLKHSETERFKR